MRAIFIGSMTIALLSGCSATVSDLSDQVQGTLSGTLAPVKGAVDEVARRANEVQEGIQGVSTGIKQVKGAFSGSGATW